MPSSSHELTPSLIRSTESIIAAQESTSPTTGIVSSETISKAPTKVAHQMVTCSRVRIRKPNPKDLKLRMALLSSDVPYLPCLVITAKRHLGWAVAKEEEIAALATNTIWQLVPPQFSMNIVGCKWVYRAKLKHDGSLDRLKAR